MAEEVPRIPELGDHLIKAVHPVIASNRVPYHQMMSLGWHSMSRREKKGKADNGDT